MILVDTNIIIDFWKKPSEEYRKIFLDEDVAICGIVIAELIHGAKNAVLSFIAIKNEIPIWTKDNHFYLIKDVWKELKILEIE